ncbi:MAG: hypothetical protein IJV33_05070, partial [Bacteroidaceae bacterium]|nr:hypothetical protein [Bacteroidaceae bacterium]
IYYILYIYFSSFLPPYITIPHRERDRSKRNQKDKRQKTAGTLARPHGLLANVSAKSHLQIQKWGSLILSLLCFICACIRGFVTRLKAYVTQKYLVIVNKCVILQQKSNIIN